MMSFARACLNLRLVLGAEAQKLLEGLDPMEWYPLARYYRLCDLVASGYTDAAPILERIGVESMRVWYEHGDGKLLMKKSLDFLAIQAGEGGYKNVFRGPPEQLGAFQVTHLDEAAGKAVITSSTVTNRDLERGVLYGGLQLMGDLAYVHVDNSADPDVFKIEFH